MAPFARIKTSVDALGWTAVKGTILALWFTSRAAQTEKKPIEFTPTNTLPS